MNKFVPKFGACYARGSRNSVHVQTQGEHASKGGKDQDAISRYS
jgi:hypothetical protein